LSLAEALEVGFRVEGEADQRRVALISKRLEYGEGVGFLIIGYLMITERFGGSLWEGVRKYYLT